MDLETLLYEVDADGIALVTINRPEKLNALTNQTLDELEHVFLHVDGNDAVRAVIVTGAGTKSFVAGADISQFRNLTALDGHRFALRGQAVFNRIESLSKPVVCAVNGYALGGGCELALHADIIIAGEDARFGQPEINLGIMPGAGGTQRLLRAVGKSLATQMVLTGESIGARRAREAKLVSEITQPELTVDRATALAETIAAKAPLAVRLARESLRKAEDSDLDTGLRFERHAFTLLAGTQDRNEGIRAFQEKRPALFKGC